jgi:flagellar hook-associated protein 1 FlgK
MSSLFAALTTAASSMDALEKAMGVVQNNVTNASTPGYASQSINLEAQLFDPSGHLSGGVTTAGLADSRNQFAEQAVWNQNELLGSATQSATSLSALQSVFNVSGTSGIPGALSTLSSALSAWSSNPSDAPSQQQVLNAVQGLSQAFNTAGNSVSQISTQTNQQLQSTVSQINALTSQIAQLNTNIRQGNQSDPGLQAQLYNDLEQLSNLTSINVQTEGDGTVTVTMAGQTPLVVGGTVTTLAVSFTPSAGASNADAPPDAQIVTSGGQNVTSIASSGSGQLAALVEFQNVTIPSVIGDGQSQGSLNQLAQSIADQVNTLIESGQTGSGAQAVPLFTYAGMVDPPGSTSSSPTSVASTLALNPAFNTSQLVAAGPDSSSSGSSTAANGIADQLAQLSTNGTVAANGTSMTFTDFYSAIAAAIGNQESSASAAQQTQSQLLSQAQSARSQLEGVSLNQQAALLEQFQQGYEAASEMISVVNNTTQYLMQTMEQLQG